MSDTIATDAPAPLEGLRATLAQHLTALCNDVEEPASVMLVASTADTEVYLLAGNNGELAPVHHLELAAAAVAGLGSLMRPPEDHPMHNAPAISLGLAVLAQYAAQQLGLHEPADGEEVH